jgi:sn-glycerol 3-phosphate transport system ATP-binding protein
LADVELTSVTKSWAGKAAVDAVSFRARSGSFVALLGPSGCGKSTTLRLIAGLDAPSQGTIHIGGRDVSRLPPSQRGVAMVFQSYALFPHLSVAENILFGLKVRKFPAAEQRRRLDRAAEMLGLSQLLDRKPSQLSGGQQQRAALGRAIVAETPVCLMDEPLSNLDAQLRVEMRREIRELQQRLGITMLYVTHDQLEAMTMADQVILMRDGHIEQDAAPAILYETPATTFAARFVGTPPMNVLPLDELGEATAVVKASAPGTLPVEKLALGVRPELIRIGDTGIAARIEAIEYLGADSLVAARVGHASLQIRTAGKPPAGRGDMVRLAWDSQSVHWFDLSSGRRLT